MPDTHTHWRTDRPVDGFYTTELGADPTQPVRTFLPDDYLPRYPYPLLVLFHPHGGNEEQVLRLAPRLSRRNFVAIGLRGPERVGDRPDGSPACGWGAADGLTETLLRAVEQTRRTYHIHSERVFLVGVGDGAAAAYRAAFALGDRVAGVAALNGTLPRAANGAPLFRIDQVRRLRVLIAHGAGVPADRDHRVFYAAGADVRRITYPTGRLCPEMLKDVNRWVIGQVNAEHDVLVQAAR
jgi:phospholipase/carboxylesterase